MRTTALLFAALAGAAARPVPAPRPRPFSAAPAPAPARGVEPRPWSVGERLDYQVKFDLFTIGRATLQVLDIDTIRGEPCYHVVFTVHGHALFYTLDDSLQSWFGVDDLVSRRFTQNTEENGNRRRRSYEFFPERSVWIKDGTDTAATVPDPLDEASFFFFARTLPLGPDDSYTLPRYFILDRNPVRIRVLGRQNIGVPAGRFPAVAVRPIFRSRGLFSEDGEAIVWFSDDSLRLPLRIRSTMTMGTLDISLRARN